MFHTLQEYLTHTEGATYILMVVALVGVAGFWQFLSARDDDDN